VILARVDSLLEAVKLSPLPEERGFFSGKRVDLHEVLNKIDSAIGADTEWLSSLECKCLWHIGKCCHNRRAVGARVRMLEECLALDDLKRSFAV
jgi:hypothetical protein